MNKRTKTFRRLLNLTPNRCWLAAVRRSLGSDVGPTIEIDRRSTFRLASKRFPQKCYGFAEEEEGGGDADADRDDENKKEIE